MFLIPIIRFSNFKIETKMRSKWDILKLQIKNKNFPIEIKDIVNPQIFMNIKIHLFNYWIKISYCFFW